MVGYAECCAFRQVYVVGNAASSGSVELVHWLMHEQCGSGDTDEVCFRRYLFDTDPACSSFGAGFGAVAVGHLELLCCYILNSAEWSRSSQCSRPTGPYAGVVERTPSVTSFDDPAMPHAISGGSLEAVHHLLAHGLIIFLADCISAAEYNCLEFSQHFHFERLLSTDGMSKSVDTAAAAASSGWTQNGCP